MKALVFDTETNGFKRRYKHGPSREDKQGRVIQLAWEIIDVETGFINNMSSYLIKPDGWIIPSIESFKVRGLNQEAAIKAAKFWTDHGFNTRNSIKEGIPLPDVLKHFIAHINVCDILVAHNLAFDKDILSAEMVRYRMRASKRLPTFCTMNDARPQGAKMSLSALHEYLFNEPFDGAHDAGHDVNATGKCFVEMVRRKLIDPYKIIEDAK